MGDVPYRGDKYCYLIAKTIGITCFLLKSYKNNRTKKEEANRLLFFGTPKERTRKGERWERCRWRVQRPERVAAVDKIEE